MNLVTRKKDSVTTTSKIISDSFGKIHRDVMRSIANLDCSEDFRARNFAQSSYTSEQNKELACYEITRDGFAFLCMGFTGKEAAKWKETYINAFNSMETAILNPPATMETLNLITVGIEERKSKASQCGSYLQSYKTVKKEDEQKWLAAVDEAQSTFNFK